MVFRTPAWLVLLLALLMFPVLLLPELAAADQDDDDEDTIDLEIKLVDAGSKILGDKFEDEKFREAVQKKINDIWGQVGIKFSIDDDIDEIDENTKKKRFDHHDEDKGVLHIFLTDGDTAFTEFKDNENKKPGEGGAVIGDDRFSPVVAESPDGETTKKKDACQALSETLAHEIGHLLGLAEVDTPHVADSWFNIMWSNRRSRVGTELGEGAGDLRDDQRDKSREFAEGIKKIDESEEEDDDDD